MTEAFSATTTNNNMKGSIYAKNRILLVDDESDILFVYKLAILTNNNHNEIDAFSDSEEALEQFKAYPYAYDLVLTDVRMPRLSGFELAREIRKLRLDIPILFMTAFEIDSTEYKEVFPAAKYTDFISKPVSMQKLVEIVNKQIEKLRHRRITITKK